MTVTRFPLPALAEDVSVFGAEVCGVRVVRGDVVVVVFGAAVVVSGASAVVTVVVSVLEADASVSELRPNRRSSSRLRKLLCAVPEDSVFGVSCVFAESVSAVSVFSGFAVLSSALTAGFADGESPLMIR